jgi:hypothetical protein
MRRILLPLTIAIGLALLLWGGLDVARAQEPQAVEGFAVDVEGLYCYQPIPAQDACYVNFQSVYASANPGYSPQLTVSLGLSDDPTTLPHVAYYRGVGTTEALTVTHDMNGMGFQVACGTASPGNPRQGNNYLIRFTVATVQGEFGGATGPVACPAYVPQVPTAIGSNTFSATLDRLTRHQATFVALAVATGLLVNLLVPARLKQWRKRTE